MSPQGLDARSAIWTRRKLLPALYDLAHDGLLPERYAIVGSGGGRLDDADFRSARGTVESLAQRGLAMPA